MVLVPAGRQFCFQNSSFLMFYAQHCRIEMISTCLATFWRVWTSYLLENGTKRPSQALSTVTTIRKLNANNNNNKGAQH